MQLKRQKSHWGTHKPYVLDTLKLPIKNHSFLKNSKQNSFTSNRQYYKKHLNSVTKLNSLNKYFDDLENKTDSKNFCN